MAHPAIENVIRNCMKVKKGESVLILADTESSDIGMFFFQNAMPLAGEIGFKLDYLEMQPTTHDGAEPKKEIAEQLDMFHVIIIVTTHSLTHTNARINASKKGARIASMPGVTMEIIERTVSMDYNKIAELSKKIADTYRGKDKIHIRTEKGTDLTFSIKGRDPEEDNGIYDFQGAIGNLPAGEVCFAPIEDSANGILVVDGSMEPIGKIETELRLEFKDGKAVSIEGEGADEIKKYLHTDNDRTIAEFGIGTNAKAIITGNILEDEKVLGTIHIAIGTNTSFPGGKNKACIHFDGIVLKPTVLADGLCTIKDGELNF
ncbi:MAG: aminopeptidase [Nanoarchaeota archaeon]|nr:aminopeptidase [Nanoarchaeota archaeon]